MDGSTETGGRVVVARGGSLYYYEDLVRGERVDEWSGGRVESF